MEFGQNDHDENLSEILLVQCLKLWYNNGYEKGR